MRLRNVLSSNEKKVFNSERALNAACGSRMARTIAMRLAVLRNARNLAMVPTNPPRATASAIGQAQWSVRGGSRPPAQARFPAQSRSCAALDGRRYRRRPRDRDHHCRRHRLSLREPRTWRRQPTSTSPTTRSHPVGSSRSAWLPRASRTRSLRDGVAALRSSSARSFPERPPSRRRPRCSSRR